ncbi:MAG: sel1 repeat family protein [Rhizobiales bacterium]|jgi:TPR repeat protein|nr:sel1 repeat family protein [Hyphomicrobiales bacterium]
MARFEISAPELATMAERQPNPEGLFQLGMAYANGDEVDVDLVAAHKWFNLAAQRGYADAAWHRQQIAEEMTSSQIAAAQRAAREWLSLH